MSPKQLLLMMLCVAAMAAIGAWAATWTDSKTGYTWTYSVKGSDVKIYNYGSAAVSPKPTSSITIPSEIGGYQVVEIETNADTDTLNSFRLFDIRPL